MTLEQFSPEVLGAFGGLCTLGRDPNTVPKGLSPDCQDARFSPGYVASRDGYGCHLTNTSAVQSIASFVRDGARRLLILYADGRLTVESPEGTETVLATNLGADLKMKGTTLFRRFYFALSDGKNPKSVPWQYDGTYLDRIGTNGPAVSGFTLAGAGAGGGKTVDGDRYYFVAYRTRSGQTTRCSAPQKLTLAGGPQKVNGTYIPTGPPNTVARLICVTLSGGSPAGPFYNLPDVLTISDNTTATLNGIDFSEAELANGDDWTECLTKVLLPTCLGVMRYGDRLVGWGLLDDRTSNPPYWVLTTPFGSTNALTFDTVAGGAPLNWTGFAAGNQSAQVDSGEPGYALRIQGVALGAAAALNLDPTYAAIMSNTLTVGRRYGMRIRLRRTAGADGSLVIAVKNAVGGGTTYATATFDIGSDLTEKWETYDIPTSGTAFAAGQWVPYITITGFDDTSDYVFLGESNIYDTDPGDLLSSGLASIDTAEDFDPERSYFQVSPGDGQQLMNCFQLAGNIYGAKEQSLWGTQENGGDPITWIWQNISDVAGACGPHAVGKGNRFVVMACRSGVYYFDGGEPRKISQDIEPTWKAIDWTQRHHIWVTVDPEKQTIKVGIPTDPTVEGCTKVLSADYVQGWTDGSKADATNPLAPILKWVPETLAASCGEVAERDDDSADIFIGGGLASSNDVTKSSLMTFESILAEHWHSAGAAPTETTGQTDAMGGAQATRWQFTSGTNLISLVLADLLDEDDYYTIALRLKMKTAGATLAASFVAPAVYKGGTTVETRAITITDEWQRFTWTLGPFPADIPAGPHVYESIILNLGTGASDVLVSHAQMQKGLYDFGECVTTGTARTDVESGYIAKAVRGQTYDFCGPVQFVYEVANLGMPIGRSTFGLVALRVHGGGTLGVQLVRPDGSMFDFHGGNYPVLQSSEREDVELKCNEQATQARIRFTMSEKDSWCVLQRVGVMTKPSEFAYFRGKR